MSIPDDSSADGHKRLGLLVSGERGSVSLPLCECVDIFGNCKTFSKLSETDFPQDSYANSVSCICLCVCVRVCECIKVSLSFKAKQVESVSGAVTASNQSRDQPTIVEMKKMWFRLRFFTVFRSPTTQSSTVAPPKSLKACLCFAVCVAFFLWKFPETFRRHFVYFTSRRFSAFHCVWDEPKRWGKGNQALRTGIKVCLEYHLVCLLHCGSCFLASIRSWCSLLVVGLVVVVVAACYCICLLFILSLLLAISFKWCQSFFTCFAQVRWDYQALCVCANLL